MRTTTPIASAHRQEAGQRRAHRADGDPAGDFTCHGAEHLLLQHPLTLFFELEFNRTAESSRFFEASSITFTGNIFFEPTLNQMHGGYATKSEFCAKYGFDPERWLLLWLPSAPDVRDDSYAQVVQAVRKAGHNLAVKLHPWEYAFNKHGGPHPWGLPQSSDALWGVTAVDEADTTWAYHFSDAAILRASAKSLEMPFWGRPALVLPSSIRPELFEAQAATRLDLARDSCGFAAAAQYSTGLGLDACKVSWLRGPKRLTAWGLPAPTGTKTRRRGCRARLRRCRTGRIWR